MEPTETIESPTDPRRGISKIHVGSACHVQTAENRFGSSVLEDLKAFVFEPPNANNGMDFDDGEDDDDEEGDDDDEDIEVDITMLLDGWADIVDWDDAAATVEALTAAQFDQNDGAQDPWFGQQQQQPQQQQSGFPRVARLRCNLTALSQRYNLYFTAYQDKIYVYQPKRAPQILPAPTLILSPRRTKATRLLQGVIDRYFGHQINNMVVGNLGNFEVLFFVYDDGDVGAYYTHTIVRCIKLNSSNGPSHGTGGAPPRQAVPKEFFHDNVGLSAWGLAIHEQSRLLAVSSNRREVTVFAFATSDNPVRGESPKADNSPKVWSGQTALELERHFQSRTRTWRIVLPTGAEGHYMPSIAFCNDETGYADKVVGVDIQGNTWILDIWKIGSFPIVYPPDSTRGMANQRHMGWGVLVLSDSSFKQTGSLSESLGLPGNKIIRCPTSSRTNAPANPDPNVWLDITCRLFYVQELAPDPDVFLRQRHGPIYSKMHVEGFYPHPDAAGPLVGQQNNEDEDDSDNMFESDSSSEGAFGAPDKIEAGQSTEQRWTALTKSPGPPGAAIDDLTDEVLLCRAIIPSFGQTPALDGSPTTLIEFASESMSRQRRTKTIKFAKAEFPPYMAKNLSILRLTSTDIELQPLDPQGTGILCKSVLAYHNHIGRRNEPYDLSRHYSERISMVVHVPELNLVVLGALNGRVALLTLTKTAKRVQGVPLRRGFRVDWVLPRRAEEDKRVRPWCALHGIAMSPVPAPKAKGLDLHGRQGRVPPVQYRLMLHYMDHTILMYDVARREGDEDLMIF
ncbi:hypothetical protein B0T25DRAFT_333045 [Lasiosphaeria hispida]|uniref:Uncharacterized protein n=1 Tax=Lasiosphaeria hispida TaxID=260671 RepID=A0AAJ0M7X5_9PEZI|nr:hypothetical protein B0T25DRAFT_333045 [Lasiosphaeria hispida]